MTDVQTYLARQADDGRAAVEALIALVTAAAPEAQQGMSYGMPAFKYKGRPLVYFGAWKTHCAVYGLDIAGHRQELAGFETAKGTIRLPLGQPLPEDLLAALIRERVASIDAGER